MSLASLGQALFVGWVASTTLLTLAGVVLYVYALWGAPIIE